MPTYQYGDAPDDYRGDVRREFTLIPEGTRLQAVVAEVKEAEAPWAKRDAEGNQIPGTKDVQISFKFSTEYDDQDRVLFGNTGTEFVDHPDCKFRSWVQEILGVNELPKGFVLDTDKLVGARCDIIVGEYTKKTGKQGNNVQDVIRASAPAAPVAAAPYDPSSDPF